MLHQRTACETMQNNDNGGCFVIDASGGSWWCEINPTAEKMLVSWLTVGENVYIQSCAIFESEELPVQIIIVPSKVGAVW
jgi:hypothetical protein